MGKEPADATFQIMARHARQFADDQNEVFTLENQVNFKGADCCLTVVDQGRDDRVVKTQNVVRGQDRQIGREPPCLRRRVFEDVELLHSQEGRM